MRERDCDLLLHLAAASRIPVLDVLGIHNVYIYIIRYLYKDVCIYVIYIYIYLFIYFTYYIYRYTVYRYTYTKWKLAEKIYIESALMLSNHFRGQHFKATRLSNVLSYIGHSSYKQPISHQSDMELTSISHMDLT